MSGSILPGEIDLAYAIEHILPKQLEFIRAPEKNAVYIGGIGAGKSISLSVMAILNALKEPNGFSLIGRLNIPALRDSTMRTFLELCPIDQLAGGLAGWKPSEGRVTFANGHDVVFKHLDLSDPKVSGHLRSMNLSHAYVDEMTEITEETYFLLQGRLRRKTTERHLLRGASNPNGQDWVWRHFFSPHRKADHRGILAPTYENVNLPQDYLDNLENIYPADWKERFLRGSFAEFSDMVYKDFSDATHSWNPSGSWEVFAGRGNPPDDWPVIVGMDIGGGDEGDPWAIPIISVAPDGSLYQFAEVYGTGLRVAPIAQQLHAYLEGRSLYGLAYDYAQRAAAIELAEYGIPGVPAIKEVTPGLMKTAQYMHVDGRIEHPFLGRMGAPRYFVSLACPNTIRELTSYKWGKDRQGRPTGEPSHANSHSPDGVRYAIHTFRPEARELPLPKRWEKEGLTPASREFWRTEDKEEEKLAAKGKGKKIETWEEWRKENSPGQRRFRRPPLARFTRTFPLR